jgi:hypothetical protein
MRDPFTGPISEIEGLHPSKTYLMSSNKSYFDTNADSYDENEHKEDSSSSNWNLITLTRGVIRAIDSVMYHLMPFK